MPTPESCRLLFGPYRPPPLRRGARTSCLARDADVVITGLSSGRIPWPRCRAVGNRGGSGTLVDDELARAVRNESAAAVGYWWGVSVSTVAWWRRVLDVTRTNNEGTGRLMHRAAVAGGEASRTRGVTEEERERRRENERRHNLRRHLRRAAYGRAWTADQLALLGNLPDADLARRTRRTAEAVRIKRTRLGIPSARDRRRHPSP